MNRQTLETPPTLESLAQAYIRQAAELAALRERLEDLEDLRDLEAAEACARRAGETPMPFDPVRDLDLTAVDLVG